MNFFESQAQARKQTFRLVLLFALAVITLIIMTNILVMVAFGFLDTSQAPGTVSMLEQADWKTAAMVSAGVCVVVLAGSIYKIMALSGGGRAVAESLGGQLILQETRDFNERKVLNIVEEMAIASGTPPPPVYLLADEPGINAFAAGYSPYDAVLGVTRGTIEQLSRDQLQGVIAHEFSHVFNGDMRLNIRLMGVLHGILLIGMAGYYIMRSAAFSGRRSSNNKGGGGFLALGIGLMVIGFAGTFFGRLIKAAVSRQREYLADASAVQFTRNPDGIAGALKKIGGFTAGSAVANPSAAQISHAFFAQGVSEFMQSLTATHPPLSKRITRIDPNWDGEFDTTVRTGMAQDEADQASADRGRQAEMKVAAAVMAGAALGEVAGAMDRIGNPSRETIAHARSLIAGLPAAVSAAAHEPYGARAVVYLLVSDRDAAVRVRQLRHLQAQADPGVLSLVYKLQPEMDGLDIKYRLPLLDMAIPALKELSLSQYKTFRSNLNALIEMDAKVDLLEWSIQKILFSHLDAQFLKGPQRKLRELPARLLKPEITMILSILSLVGSNDPKLASGALDAAVQSLGLGELPRVAKGDLSLAALDRSLHQLENLQPAAKQQLLLACAACVVHDQIIAPQEVELLRAFASVLGCPMPPMQ